MSRSQRLIVWVASLMFVSVGAGVGFQISQLGQAPRAMTIAQAASPAPPNSRTRRRSMSPRAPSSQDATPKIKHVRSRNAMSVSVPAIPATYTSSPPSTPTPNGASASPPVTVMLFHGGGWDHGSPDDIKPLVHPYMRMGYRVLPVRYRIVGNNPIRQMAYCEALARRIPGTKVAYGISAGGTIAAMLASAGVVSGAVVAIAPTDLARWRAPYFTDPEHWRELGMTLPELVAGSPVNWLKSGHPIAPQLLQYGDHDPIVPLEDQGEKYFARLKTLQANATLQVAATRSHAYPLEFAIQAAAWIRSNFPVGG